MLRSWLVCAVVLLTGCGPAVEIDPMVEDEDDGEMGTTGSAGTTSGSRGSEGRPDLPPPPPPDLGSSELEVDGTYLFVVSTIVDPPRPLQFVATTRVSGGVMQLSLQPLSLEVGSTTSPREPVGEPLHYAGVPVVDGCFDLDMGAVAVPGEANPITGSNMEAAIELSGCFSGAALYCGDVAGEVFAPLTLDLTGSTFAAIPADPRMLPVDFPLSC